MPTPVVNLLHLRQRVQDSLQEALPHRAARTGNLAWAGRWPDLSPGSRERLAGRIRSWSTELRELAGEGLEADPETVHLLARLERLEAELGQPLDPLDLCTILGEGLRDLLVLPLAGLPERAGALVQRLRALPGLAEQVMAHGPAIPAWRARQAAAFLLQLTQWLGEGAETLLAESDESLALLRREAPPAREILVELARWYTDHKDSAPVPLGAEALAEKLGREMGRDIRLERLERQLEREWTRLLAQLETQAQHLSRRFSGQEDSGSPGRQLAFVLEQLAQDSPRVEHWEAYQQRQLSEQHTLITRLHLLDDPGACPGLEPRTWPEPLADWDWLPGLATHPGSLLCLDLAWLDGEAQQEYIRDRHTWAMQVLLAREALPGRLWLMNHWQRTRVAASLLNRPEDGDGWALLAPELFHRHGWGQGEPRLRMMLLRERLRDLAIALADLRWHSGKADEEALVAGLRQQGLMPGWLARLELERMYAYPGRAILALEKAEALRTLESRWKRAWTDQAQAGDLIDLLARCADLPIPWLRQQGESLQPRGRQIQELVSPLERVRQQGQDELVASLEQQLAALGRIQREDLEAGREFDAPGTARGVTVDEDPGDTGDAGDTQASPSPQEDTNPAETGEIPSGDIDGPDEEDGEFEGEEDPS